MKEIILKVEGMACEGCENRIKSALSELEGIESIEASHKEKNVKIKSCEDIDINTVKEIIKDLDFEVVD